MTLGEVHTINKASFLSENIIVIYVAWCSCSPPPPPGVRVQSVMASYLSRLISFRQKNFLHYYVFTSSPAVVLR